MKKWKRVITVLCALVCVLGLSVQAFAGSASYVEIPESVNFLHEAEGSPGSYYTNLDLSASKQASYSDLWIQAMDLLNSDGGYTVFYSMGPVASPENMFVSIFRPGYIKVGNQDIYHSDSTGYYFQLKFNDSGDAYIYSGRKGTVTIVNAYYQIHILTKAEPYVKNSNFKYSVKFLKDVTDFEIRYDSPSPESYTFTINYQYENGSQAAQPVTRSLEAGSSYEITSPIIEGYTADRPVVSGTMPEEDLTVAVTYTADPPPEPQAYTLTVNYRYENGSQAAQPVTRSLTAGSSYEITSPAIEGYTADKPVVSGTIPAEDLTVTVTYTAVPPPEPQTYTLTVNYRYENGSQAAQSVTRSLTAGSSYEITSPTIKGYTADRTIVSGIMPERDLTVHVLYRKDSSGSSSSSGKFPDVAAGVEWKDPLTWFDIAEGVEWKDPLTWFDIADGVEWKDPLTWFDIAEGVEWIDPFNYDWG